MTVDRLTLCNYTERKNLVKNNKLYRELATDTETVTDTGTYIHRKTG